MKLRTPTEADVRRYMRFVLAINLTAIKELLKQSWGFSMMVDGATHNSRGYLDVRLSFATAGKLHNFHLLAIPTGDLTHTGLNYADLVLDTMRSVAGKLVLLKLIGVATDGAANMLGCHRGFVTRVRQACNTIGGKGITANWCGSHQLNLAIGAFLSVLDAFVDFRSVLGAEISFTHTHPTVQKRIGGSCPSYSETRWGSIHNSCRFLTLHHPDLVRLQKQKKHAVSSSVWWLCLFLVSDITPALQICFARLQYKLVTVAEQDQVLQKLLSTLQFRFEENGPEGATVLSEVKIEHEICHASAFSRNIYTAMDLEQQQQLVLAVRDALQVLMDGIIAINISVDGEPPEHCIATPKRVVEISDDSFGDLVEQHQERLTHQFGGSVISHIWSQRKALKHEYATNRRFKNDIERISAEPANTAWDDSDFDRRFPDTKAFALGLASITPGTHSVEGDFSTIKRLKSKIRNRLTDFSLEGELQTSQYFELVALASLSASIEVEKQSEDTGSAV